MKLAEKEGNQMKNTLKIVVVLWGALLLAGIGPLTKVDESECRRCDKVTSGSPEEVRIEYRGGTARSACGLRCAGAMLAAYRKEDVKTIWIREYGSGQLLDAKKAFWVLGPGDRSRVAFSVRPDAEEFSKAHGGRVANF